MYLRVMTLDSKRVSVAQDELGVFEELKSFAFVPHTMTVEEYIQEMVYSAWTFYGKGVRQIPWRRRPKVPTANS